MTTVLHSHPYRRQPDDVLPERRQVAPWWLVPAIVVAAGVLSVLAWLVSGRASAAEADASSTADVANTVTAQRDATAGRAVDLAELVRQRCAVGTIADTELCSAAAVVQAQPVPEVGPPGRAGATGAIGPQGERGVPGLSPPCLAEPAQCRGADGAPGPQGPAGPAGLQGPAGERGPAGTDGQDGRDGQDGVPGAQGPTGERGPAGLDGCDAGSVRDESGTCTPVPSGG